MSRHWLRGSVALLQDVVKHTRAAGGTVLWTVILAASIGTAQAKAAVTVYGTGTYPLDVQNVQDAVDNNDVVTLSGTFNFGEAVIGFSNGVITGTPAGSIYITRPNVTLHADETTGAFIVGGGAPYSPEWYWDWPVINVLAPGVTVRGLSMTGSVDTGILVWGGPQMVGGQAITIKNNIISTVWCPLFLYFTGGVPIVLDGNILTETGEDVGGFGIWAQWTGYSLDESGQVVSHFTPFQITNNNITLAPGYQTDAILIWGWAVWRGGADPIEGYPPPLPPGTDPADWGDNGPVTIRGNTVTLDNCSGCTAINVGRSAQGLNHAVVVGNTIKGSGMAGIDKWPYGRDNKIVGNDLSGLFTWGEQLGVWARETTVADNVLGNTAFIPLLVWSVNGHPLPPSPLDTPMPLPVQNCLISGNDYTRTGVPGWSNGWGAILLASDADLIWFYGVGTEVRDNLIKETGRFPRGTGGPRQQVLEFNLSAPPLVHDNRIVGLPANQVQDPGIGQRIKEALEQRSQFMRGEIGGKSKVHR